MCSINAVCYMLWSIQFGVLMSEECLFYCNTYLLNV